MRNKLTKFKNDQMTAIRKNGVANYTMQHMRYILPVALAAFVLFSGVGATFAQEPQLNIDTTNMTTQLFSGANIIIAALGTVMFLLAGFKLGGVLIRGIVDTIGGIKF